MPYTPRDPAAAIPLPLAQQHLPIPLNPAAPLNREQPSANPLVNAGLGLGPATLVNTGVAYGAGGGERFAWELTPIAICLGVAVQWFKNRKWFHEATWTVPLVFVLGFGVAVLFWIVLPILINGAVDLATTTDAFIKGAGIVGNMHTNYENNKAGGLPMFKPTEPDNRFGA